MVVNLGDGSANAPSGVPQLGSLLIGYAVRPSWNVAGVDYAVGIPVGIVLQDPATGALPAGVTRNITNHVLYVTGDNVTVNGWDFSREGGWTVEIEGNNATIENCNFEVGPNLRPPISVDSSANNVTIINNNINGAGIATNPAGGLLVLNAMGTTTLEYNLIQNAYYQLIQAGPSSNGPSTQVIQYNVLENAGLGAPQGAHGDWVQDIVTSSNPVFQNIQINFNTLIQNNQTAATQGLSILSAAGQSGGYAQRESISNNTVMVPSGANVNYPFIIDNTWLNGTAVVDNNYIDPTSVGGAYLYAGRYNSTDGPYDGTVTTLNNVNMVTGVYYPQDVPSNPPPPTGTTADMIIRDGSNGDYEIYDLGDNAILAAGFLGQVGTEWQVAGLGRFDGSDTSDMLLRNSVTGAFEVYDIGNNNITNAAALGQVGLEWQAAGFGDFSSRAGETDMLMRDAITGQFEIYDISNNAITSSASMGQVGTEWQVAGFGDFSGHSNETDMLMRNSSTGQFEIYDISNNKLTSAASMGQVGLEWQVAGFGDFSGNANETDMLMRNTSTGKFEIYDISNNAITDYSLMGQVGLEWQVIGFWPINGAGASDMLMRDANNGAFEVYDISNNQITTAASLGQVGTEWSIAGIAADLPGGSAAANAQLLQAMASYAPNNSAVVTPSVPGLPTTQSTVPNILTAANS